jgi:hypothetical protein
METLNFEALKLTLKQDASGYVLQLRIHPNELARGTVSGLRREPLHGGDGAFKRG